MTNLTPKDLTIGYCTNVHAGVDLPAIRRNLDQYAVAVRCNLGDDQPLGVGLWIPDAASRELAVGSAAQDFAAFLADRQLTAFTINGFPYDNFHQDVVKHRVYLPTWWDRKRLEYTQRLAKILAIILPASESVGSISTLPIGWPGNPLDVSSDGNSLAANSTDQQLARSGEHLRELSGTLKQIELDTGRRIVVAIEPEPGCILDTTDDVIGFFDQQLPESDHRRYLTVCHDVCHAAVMMEQQSDVIRRFAQAGIGIGKVQVSSAVVADWESMSDGRRREALEQLSQFAEDRYLHQTGRIAADGGFTLSEDLPELIRAVGESDAQVVQDKRWVVHFHVPIFLERFGHLTTSHHDVLECMRTLIGPDVSVDSANVSVDFSGHLEIETYAWTVLPEAMRKHGLAEDIASEVEWLRKIITTCV